MSVEFEDTYEEFMLQGQLYTIELTCEITVDSVDRDPGPMCGVADFNTDIRVDNIYHVDWDTDARTLVPVDSDLGKLITKEFKRTYEPDEKYYDMAYENSDAVEY